VIRAGSVSERYSPRGVSAVSLSLCGALPTLLFGSFGTSRSFVFANDSSFPM
jgi:hypothetical protein